MAQSGDAEDFYLTKEEAFSFIKEVLHIQDVEVKFQEDRVSFLNLLISSMHQVVPFQTIVRCSVPQEFRHRPKFPDIKRNLFLGYGGTCETLQSFFKCLLDAVGYRTDYFPVSILGNPNGHLGIMVHDLQSEGSQHMADVGCGFPIFTMIPMDFEKESPLYSHLFLRHKFIRLDDGTVEWHHMSRDGSDDWYRFAEMNVTKFVDISFFLDKNELDHADPTNKFNTAVWASHMKGGDLASVRGTTVKWSQGTELFSKQVNNGKELKMLIHKEFPQFPIEMIEASLKNTGILK